MPDDHRPSKRRRPDNDPAANPPPSDSQFVSAAFAEPVQMHDMSAAIAEGSSKKRDGKKPPLSCAECRRLKLKCDRVFPCTSCRKRGVGEICPNGSLTSGKGSRFILANTEKLHAKIVQMSDRIRHLEEALESEHALNTTESHPLLQPDLLSIKTTLELHGTIPGPSDSAPYENDDTIIHSTEIQSSQSPEQSPDSQPPVPRVIKQKLKQSGLPEIPSDIYHLGAAFPVTWAVRPDTRKRIFDLLPSQEDAEHVCEQARQNIFWQHNLDPSESFLPNLIHSVYHTSVRTLSSRRLALFCMILCVGSCVDLTQDSESLYPEFYHHLARAALCEQPILEEPDFDMLHAIFYMVWYLIVFCDHSAAISSAWNIMGFAVKLSQSVGLHRDSYRSKMIPEETEKRRMFFWELLILDARLALSLGRPPSLSLQHVGCNRPAYTDEKGFNTSDSTSYREWKHTFFVECLNPLLNAVVAAKLPSYATIIELDRKIRDTCMPPKLDLTITPASKSRPLIMQQAVASSMREIAILQLHRNTFAQALNDTEVFTIRHKYAPSVLAVFLSARQLIINTELFCKQEPKLCLRYLCYWFNTISGAVALGLLVSRLPHAPMAPYALRELDKICRLFVDLAEDNPKAAKTLSLLTKLTEKSRRIYTRWLKESRTPSLTGDSGEISYDADSGQSLIGSSGVRTQVSDTRSAMPPEPEVDPFQNVHPALLEGLREAQTKISLPIHDPFTIASNPSPLAWPYAEEKQANMDSPFLSVSGSPDDFKPSTRFADPLLSRENNFGLPLDPSVYSTYSSAFAGSSGSRVPNHETFNFDFGALSSDLSTQAWMSWF